MDKRLEVLTRPTEQDMRFQICWFLPTGKSVHHCTSSKKLGTITKPGVYEKEFDISGMVWLLRTTQQELPQYPKLQQRQKFDRYQNLPVV